MDQNIYDLDQEEIANDKWMVWYNADKQIAEDRALDILVMLPPQEFMDLMIKHGLDQTPKQVAIHEFFDRAWREIRETDPLEG